MGFCIVIPARYDSSRLPGKPLRDLAGKPMLQHVYECAVESDADKVIIATDDQRIYDAANGFGAEVCMTGTQHRSGTERIAEVIDKLHLSDDTIIVNLQGDEPMMPSGCLNQVAGLLQDNTDCVMATLCEPIESVTDIFDPNVVKVVRDKYGHAIYFSRAPIPWHRDAFHEGQPDTLADLDVYFRHIGLYAYSAAFVKAYLSMETSPLEKIESLEQLRVLWHGKRIALGTAVASPGPGVDTEADLQQVALLINNTQ